MAEPCDHCDLLYPFCNRTLEDCAEQEEEEAAQAAAEEAYEGRREMYD